MVNVAIDLETSHLKCSSGVILQMTFAAFDEDYKVISKFDTFIKPYPDHFDLIKKVINSEYDTLSDDDKIMWTAMDINQIKIETLDKYDTTMETRNNFITWWQNELGSEKIFPLGQNFDRFDWRFLENFFGGSNISKYFHYKSRQTDTLLQALKDAEYLKDLESTSLVCACEYFGIHHDAHDSFGDVHATIQLYKKLISFL